MNRNPAPGSCPPKIGTKIGMCSLDRMIAVQIGEGKQLHNIVWQGCDDSTRDRIRDCVRATRYRGRMIEHAT
jgi:hypothetical protein